MNAARARVRRIDACGLEPVGLVLDALGELDDGEQLCLLVEREPFPLYRVLSNHAYAYCTSMLDGTLYEVAIWRCGAQAA